MGPEANYQQQHISLINVYNDEEKKNRNVFTQIENAAKVGI